MSKKYPKAISGEKKWVDFDEEMECWGIFGVDSEHCYSTWSSEAEAKKKLQDEEEKQKELEKGFDLDECFDNLTI